MNNGDVKEAGSGFVREAAVAAAAAALGTESGNDGDGGRHDEKYRDFDGYLGNFASKRRTKVRS